MSTVDERVVQMQFQNAAFERGVQQTIASLERLQKSLQLQDASKGITNAATKIAATSQQFDRNVLQNRDSMGKFTKSVVDSSTSSTASLGKISTGVQQVATSVSSGFEKAKTSVSGFTQSVGGFGDRIVASINKIKPSADKQAGSLKNLENGVNSIATRFSALQQVATGALHNIGAQAVTAGGQFVKSFTFGPVMEGFREYETNMNSIQTILSNTKAAGTNLKDVTRVLDDLNHYSDQTIYNFSEMTRNIGLFTAAGVDLETSATAIKGIANLAAMSGTNSQMAAAAMTQLSQAISSGKVTLEDWESVRTAGMGGTVFQRALAQTAVAMGKLDSGAVKLTGKMKNLKVNGLSFRDSISSDKGSTWLTSDVLTATLQQFAGDLSDAELAAQGFTKAQIKAIQAQAKTAVNAATEVKTLSGLIDTTKEGLTSGWAETWKIVFGDFMQAKGLFTGISDGIGGMLKKSSEARNKMLKEWDKFGGRDALIDGLTNAFKALASFIKPIKDAFREIFPATTGKQLAEMTKNFRDFTERLKIGSQTADRLKRTFAGVFAVFSIVWEIVKEATSAIFELVGVATEGSGGFLELTAKIGDFLVNLRDAIVETDGLKNTFKAVVAILKLPIKALQIFGDALARIFGDVDGSAVTDAVAGAAEKMEPMGRFGEIAAKAWGKVVGVFENLVEMGSKALDFFEDMGLSISDALSNLGLEDIFAGTGVGLLAGIFMMFRNLIGGGGLGGILGSLADAFDNITGALGAMQNTLRAATLLQIAIAIGILALAMNTLAKIPKEKLLDASAAMYLMFTQLMGSMLIFEKFASFTGFAKMPFVAVSMILLATAVNILASAMTKMAALDWNGVAKGLTGVTVLLGGLIMVAKFMPPMKGFILSAAGMVVMAFAIKKLAESVVTLSALSWEEMAKGLVGVGALIAALALFANTTAINVKGFISGIVIAMLAAALSTLADAVEELAKLSWSEMARGLTVMAGGLALISSSLKFLPPASLLSAAAIFIVASSLGIIGDALKSMAGMSWEDIAKSLVTLAGALGIIAGSLYLMQGALPGAVALAIVSGALVVLANSMITTSGMTWEQIAKSLVVLAGSLGIIVGALYLMTGALPGAAALIIVAGALSLLAPVMVALGNMSWEGILKSLAALAGVFLILGVAGLLLTPVIPTLIGLAAALVLLGAGMLLAGVGVLAFGAGIALLGAGITALAASGVAAAAAMVAIIAALLGALPMIVELVGKLLIGVMQVIIKAAPKIAEAVVVVLESLIKAIVRVTPKIVDAVLRMLTMLLQKLAEYVPKMVDAGMRLITGILNGIAKNINKMVTAATDVVVNFINGIAKNLPRVIDAGVKLIISFVNGVANAIRSNTAAMNAAGRNLASAIIEGMISGISSGISSVTAAAGRVASAALSSAKSVLGINSPSKEFEKIGKFVNDGFVKGLDGNKTQVYKAFDDLKKMLKDLSKNSKASASERKKAAAAYTTLTKQYNDEKTAIGKLSDQYDKLTEKIKKADEAYQNAIKTRDDYRKQISEKYSDVASPTGETTLTSYITDLKKQIEDTKLFSNALQRLRAFGLNDELYKDLLEQGPSALPFINELLDKGIAGVTEVNKLGKDLDAVGAHLGKTGSDALYQAGVNSAKGFLDGLKQQQKLLEKVMDNIAASMVRAIKKKLGIKSPSRVFMEIGAFSAEGLVKGLDEMSGIVERSAERTGTAAVESLRKSLSGFSDLITQDVDSQPIITPVLDLSSIKRDAGQIGGIFGGRSLSVDSAYAKAKYVAAGHASNQAAYEQEMGEFTPAPVSFVQYNYSPKALSSAEIYRQTNNQLSKAKGALTTNANSG